MAADGGLDSGIVLPPKLKVIRAADLFCGAGGTSTGARRAARDLGFKLDLVAINHWDIAIETHSKMHPEAKHLCADLEHVRPRQAVPGGVLDILMASPTCTYYSRARGGRPVHDQQRMDPWHVVRWCSELRVHRLLVENVPEMTEWGPCDSRTGKPIKSRKGEYFHAWLNALKAIGFKLDWQIIGCADLGDPTTRERFFLIGRSDKKVLHWPEPTHAKGGATDMLGTRAPWRGAKEIIDWTIRGKSIFRRKKPLVDNTLTRLLSGAKRNRWPRQHVEALQALLEGRTPRLHVTREEAIDIARQLGTPLVMATGAGGVARGVDQPLPTVTGGGDGGARPHFVQPLIMGAQSNATAKAVDENPAPAITTIARVQLAEPMIVHKGNSDGGRSSRPTSEPTPTVTTAGGGFLAEPVIVSKHGGPGNTARGVDGPMFAVDTGGGGAIAQPIIGPYYGNGSGKTSIGADQPVPAIPTNDRFGLAQPTLIQTDQTGSAGRVTGADVPVGTLVSKANQGLAVAFIGPCTHHDTSARMRPIDEPLPTVTGANRGELAMAQPFLVPSFGENVGQAPRTHQIEDPVPTIAATGHIQIAEPTIDEEFYIDILYRMLHWRELARATSFDDEGEVYQFCGNATEITKQIGNAVPCRTSKALVKALLEV